MGIVIDANPTIVNIGHIMLNWYSIIIILAVIAAVLISVREGRRKGIPPDDIYSMLPWLLIGGIVGARLFHVVDLWGFYSVNPALIPAIWQGGLAIWGALAGGAAGVTIYALKKHIPIRRLADTLVPGVMAAQIIGRFACIIDGDAVGGATNLPWAFTYVNPNAMVPQGLLGVPVHPYPVYDQLWNLAGLIIVLKLRKHIKEDGLLFLGYLAYYGAGRLLLSFVRQEKIWFWGLQEAQVMALVIILIAMATLLYRWRKMKAGVHQQAAN